MDCEMAASDEQSPDELLAPLPSWQLFANVATQSELLDEVAELEVESLGEGVASAPLAADTAYAVDAFEKPAAPVRTVPQVGISLPEGPGAKKSAPVAPAAAPLITLDRRTRRSIFVPPLPTVADVEPGVEPDVRTIAAVGSEYQPGSLGRIIGT